ncbi:MAG TPA: hypothetical protein VGH19_00055 [Verrucomicrobiae bacterium]
MRYWQSVDMNGLPMGGGAECVGGGKCAAAGGDQPPARERRYCLSSLPVGVQPFALALERGVDA